MSKRKELDRKARRGIVLRSLPRGVYPVWDIEKQRIVHVRHVRINENVFPAKGWDKNGAAKVCETMERWCKPETSYIHDDLSTVEIGHDFGLNEMEINSISPSFLSEK